MTVCAEALKRKPHAGLQFVIRQQSFAYKWKGGTPQDVHGHLLWADLHII